MSRAALRVSLLLLAALGRPGAGSEQDEEQGGEDSPHSREKGEHGGRGGGRGCPAQREPRRWGPPTSGEPRCWVLGSPMHRAPRRWVLGSLVPWVP